MATPLPLLSMDTCMLQPEEVSDTRGAEYKKQAIACCKYMNAGVSLLFMESKKMPWRAARCANHADTSATPL